MTTLIWAGLLLHSFAAPATSAELNLRRQWVEEHFDAKASALPFSLTYRKLKPCMVGDFYPLLAHSDSEEVWFGYQFDRADLKAGTAILFRRGKSKDTKMVVPLRGLDARRNYAVSLEDTPDKQTAPGDTLSALSVEIPASPGSAIVYYRARK